MARRKMLTPLKKMAAQARRLHQDLNGAPVEVKDGRRRITVGPWAPNIPEVLHDLGALVREAIESRMGRRPRASGRDTPG